MSDHITEEMLPEFEVSPEVAREQRAWSALSVLERGASEEDMKMIFNLTYEELLPYKKEWEEVTGKRYERKRPD